MQHVITRINATLFHRLPVNMFLAAAFLELDRYKGEVRIWNAALPAVTLVRAGKIAGKFSSSMPPLGISQHLPKSDPCTQDSLTAGDRIYLFTDGIEETCSSTGELFGEGQMDRFLEESFATGTAMEALLPVLEDFRSGEKATDDITFVEVMVS